MFDNFLLLGVLCAKKENTLILHVRWKR